MIQQHMGFYFVHFPNYKHSSLILKCMFLYDWRMWSLRGGKGRDTSFCISVNVILNNNKTLNSLAYKDINVEFYFI